MPSVGFEPAIPGIESLQKYILERAATGISWFVFPLNEYDLSVKLLPIFSLYFQELFNITSR